MSGLLSVDPGTRVCGAALWSDGVLVAAAAVKNPIPTGSDFRECVEAAREVLRWARYHDAERIDILALEKPQVYQPGGDRTVGDPNGLVPLAAIDGALAAMLGAPVKAYWPKEWGAVGKPDRVSEPYPVERRVRDRLSSAELRALEAEWPGNVKHSYDLVDAVAIGLHHLGRFGRGRVLARE